MNEELAAARLSRALGRKVTSEDVAWVGWDGVVLTKDGGTFQLFEGNAAYIGAGQYMRNGRPWPAKDAAGAARLFIDPDDAARKRKAQTTFDSPPTRPAAPVQETRSEAVHPTVAEFRAQIEALRRP